MCLYIPGAMAPLIDSHNCVNAHTFIPEIYHSTTQFILATDDYYYSTRARVAPERNCQGRRNPSAQQVTANKDVVTRRRRRAYIRRRDKAAAGRIHAPTPLKTNLGFMVTAAAVVILDSPFVVGILSTAAAAAAAYYYFLNAFNRVFAQLSHPHIAN